jgi:hypothetical protein
MGNAHPARRSRSLPGQNPSSARSGPGFALRKPRPSQPSSTSPPGNRQVALAPGDTFSPLSGNLTPQVATSRLRLPVLRPQIGGRWPDLAPGCTFGDLKSQKALERAACGDCAASACGAEERAALPEASPWFVRRRPANSSAYSSIDIRSSGRRPRVDSPLSRLSGSNRACHRPRRWSCGSGG